MLHGTPPFRAKNPREISRLISESKFPLGNHISDNAKQLITMILQEQPEIRPNLLEILKSQWIQDNCEKKIEVNWKIIHPTLGEGIVKEVIGVVCIVSFITGEEELIDAEIIRLYTVINQTGNAVFEPFGIGKIMVELDSEKLNTKNSPLNKNTRKDSLDLLSPKVNRSALKAASAKNSKNSSRNHTPGENLDAIQILDPTKGSPRLMKSPKIIEETKRSQQLPSRKIAKHDFEGIEISHESKPLIPEKKTVTPKSRFLLNWNAGIKPKE